MTEGKQAILSEGPILAVLVTALECFLIIDMVV